VREAEVREGEGRGEVRGRERKEKDSEGGEGVREVGTGLPIG